MLIKQRSVCVIGLFLSGVAWTFGQSPDAKVSQRPAAARTSTADTPAVQPSDVAAAAANSQAAIPRLIKFSGILQNLTSKPISGPVDVTFSLYADEAGGAPLWFETQTVQADALGSYTVLLGAMTPTGVPMELFTEGQAHWLGVQVASLPEQPRVLLVSVPYAMKAGDADTLGGKPASAYLLSSQAGSSAAAAGSAAGNLAGLITKGSTTTKTTNESPVSNAITSSYIPVYTDGIGTTANSIMFQSGTKIGVNTNAPAFNFDVNGNVFAIGPKAAAPGAGGTMRFRDDTGTQRWLFGIPGSAGSQDFQMYNYANGHAPIFIQNGAASYSLYLSDTGNVGIATTSPSARLEVNGTAKFDSPVTFASTQNFGSSTSILTGSSETLSGNSASQVLNVNQTGTGAAAVLNTTGTGEILSGQKSGVEKFAVDGNGSVTIAGNLNLPQNTSSSVGVITLAGGRFISACCVADQGNTFLGPAGNFVVTGAGETGVGVSSLASVTSGGYNTAVGGFTLFQVTSGAYNTATGAFALDLNTASYNTANGAYALQNNTTGADNVAVGYNALQFNTTGAGNAAVGDSALNANTTGGGNTATGYRALFSNTTGGSNTATGLYALISNSTGFSNSAFGAGALIDNTTGIYNTASGTSALGSNTTGNFNAANGSGTLTANTTGSYNTATGASSLASNTTGSYNVTEGSFALKENDTGNSNVAVGYCALLNDYGTTGFASSCSPPSFSQGAANTAIGTLAGQTVTTGNFNTFLGYLADASSGTIVNATAVGAFAQVGQSNSIVLGSINGVNGGSSDVHVGIGTTTPISPLQVATGDIVIGPTTTLPYSNTNGLYVTNDLGDAHNTFRLDAYKDDLAIAGFSASGAAAGTSITFRTAAAGAGESGRMRITSAGNVGIGTLGPAHALDVVGDIAASGCVAAGGSTLGGTCVSDIRLKTDIRPFAHVLDRVALLQPVHFRWSESAPAGYSYGPGQSTGLIAQDVEQVFPELVSTDPNGYRKVNYSEIPYLTLESVRELKAENDGLRSELHQEESRLQAMTGEIKQLRKAQADRAALETRLARLEAQVAAATPKRSAATLSPSQKSGVKSVAKHARVKF